MPGKYSIVGKRLLTFGLQLPYLKHLKKNFLLLLKKSRDRTNVRDPILYCKAVQKEANMLLV